MRDENGHTPREAAIAALASEQYGVVSLAQLLDLGLSRSAVRNRVSGGRLHRLHHGAYAVGHPLVPLKGRWLAAVLATGAGTVLSHRDAAALHGLRPAGGAVIDVTAGRSTRRTAPGIHVHASRTLLPRDTTVEERIPCTTVARTLLDLAETVSQRELNRAVERAEVLKSFDLSAIQDVLDRGNGRRGAPRLRRAVAGYEHTPTRNDFERLLLTITREAGIPDPLVNQWLPDHAVEVDFLWPDDALIVETDGFETHGTLRAFNDDRRRDRRLKAAGYEVHRFTWEDLTSDPQEVARTIRSSGSSARRRPLAA